MAADGMCLRLLAWGENIDQYGMGPCADGSVAMARCVALYSVASQQWLEIIVGRYDEGERELLLKALDQLEQNDILVLDRGYPAWWLFAALQGRGIKLRLPTGQWQVLATSLIDMQRYPAADFSELYCGRWGIEEGFKLVKQRQHIEGFSGELPESIEQEIQAKIMLHNIVQATCRTAQKSVPPDKQGSWRVNRAYALKQIGHIIIACFKGTQHALRRCISALIQVLAQTLERIRPGRSFHRKRAIGGAQRSRKSYK